MELKQALELVEKALNKAQQSGVYTLEESAIIFSALSVVKNKFELAGEGKLPEVETKPKK